MDLVYAGVFEGFDGVDDVMDRGAAADADVAVGGGEVVSDGFDGGISFGGFDVGFSGVWEGLLGAHFGGEVGRCAMGNRSADDGLRSGGLENASCELACQYCWYGCAWRGGMRTKRVNWLT